MTSSISKRFEENYLNFTFVLSVVTVNRVYIRTRPISAVPISVLPT